MECSSVVKTGKSAKKSDCARFSSFNSLPMLILEIANRYFVIANSSLLLLNIYVHCQLGRKDTVNHFQFGLLFQYTSVFLSYFILPDRVLINILLCNVLGRAIKHISLFLDEIFLRSIRVLLTNEPF